MHGSGALALYSTALNYGMAQPRDSMGSLGALGSTIKLNPPVATEVTVDNFPDWSWKMKKYLGLQDPMLPGFLTELADHCPQQILFRGTDLTNQ